MNRFDRRGVMALAALGLLGACAPRRPGPQGGGSAAPGSAPGGPAAINAEIARVARALDIPESLLHRVVRAESGYNPAARNGPYYGLMQIHPQTAATMGYDGPPEGLLDPATNLRFGGRYLRGAWLVARGNADAAIGWYRRGYYYEARRMGLLEATGLR